jgi:hypothetical protein
MPKDRRLKGSPVETLFETALRRVWVVTILCSHIGVAIDISVSITPTTFAITATRYQVMFELTTLVILSRYLSFWCLLTQSVFTVASSYTNTPGYAIWQDPHITKTLLSVPLATGENFSRRYSLDRRRSLTERKLTYFRAYLPLSSTPCAAESSNTNDNPTAIGTSTAASISSSPDASQSQPTTTQKSSLKPLGARNQSLASTTNLAVAEYTEAPQPVSCPLWHTGVWMPFDPNERPYNFNNTLLSYMILCGVNLAAGMNPSITDLQRLPSVKSLATCVNHCARYTMNLPTVESDSGSICHAVTLDVDDTCFLKRRNDSIAQSSPYISGPNGKASAVLSFEVRYNVTTWVANNPPALGDMWPNITKS